MTQKCLDPISALVWPPFTLLWPWDFFFWNERRRLLLHSTTNRQTWKIWIANNEVSSMSDQYPRLHHVILGCTIGPMAPPAEPKHLPCALTVRSCVLYGDGAAVLHWPSHILKTNTQKCVQNTERLDTKSQIQHYLGIFFVTNKQMCVICHADRFETREKWPAYHSSAFQWSIYARKKWLDNIYFAVKGQKCSGHDEMWTLEMFH